MHRLKAEKPQISMEYGRLSGHSSGQKEKKLKIRCVWRIYHE